MFTSGAMRQGHQTLREGIPPSLESFGNLRRYICRSGHTFPSPCIVHFTCANIVKRVFQTFPQSADTKRLAVLRSRVLGNLNALCLNRGYLEADMRTVSPHREISYHAMPYCPDHNRLYPHPFVGWLTPASVEGLALIPYVRCDLCYKESGDVVLSVTFQSLSTLAAQMDHYEDSTGGSVSPSISDH